MGCGIAFLAGMARMWPHQATCAGSRLGDEAGERADGGQPQVAGLRRAAALVLYVAEELQHASGREVAHGQPFGGLANPAYRWNLSTQKNRWTGRHQHAADVEDELSGKTLTFR